jgi:hypothetical protein
MSALEGQLLPVQLSVVTQHQDPRTLEIKKGTRTVNGMALIQPLSTRELELKREGERSWTWLKVYAVPSVVLRPRDTVVIPPGPFRGTYEVMASKPWETNGYAYYELVDKFHAPNPYGD